jgi:hypothetical protein
VAADTAGIHGHCATCDFVGTSPSIAARCSVLVANFGMDLPRTQGIDLGDETIFEVLGLNEAGEDQPIMRQLAPFGGVALVARIIGHPSALGGRVGKFSLLPHATKNNM